MQNNPSIRRRQVTLLALSTALLGAWPSASLAVRRRSDEHLTAFRGTALGTVTAIDTAARKLTVRGPRGEAIYRADPKKIASLEAIKVGDAVRVDYVAGIGLTVRRGDDTAAAAPSQPVAKTPEAGERIQGVLRVLAIDRDRQTVRLQGPKGEAADVPVLDKADLVGVRVGDQVTVVVYELVAVKVVPAAK